MVLLGKISNLLMWAMLIGCAYIIWRLESIYHILNLNLW